MVAVGSLIFFLSGFTALLYQVVWQRLLGLFSGADVHAATITVSAFMGGLGCGSLVGGRIADQLSKRGNLATFAFAELAVGGFGFFSATLYYDVLYLRFGHLAEQASAVPALLFVSLLWPTFFMGMSLPLLARALTPTIDDAPTTVGALYGLNTLGASAGALFTTWWLVPSFGLSESLRISALLNIGVAIAAALLATRIGGVMSQPLEDGRLVEAVAPSTAAAPAGGGLSFPVWLGLYCLSGFLALSLEIVWFRMLGVMGEGHGVHLRNIARGLPGRARIGCGGGQSLRAPGSQR